MKKFIIFALLFALMFSLFGCNNNAAPSVSSEINDNETSSISPEVDNSNDTPAEASTDTVLPKITEDLPISTYESSVDPIIGRWELTYVVYDSTVVPASKVSTTSTVVFNERRCNYCLNDSEIDLTWEFVETRESFRLYKACTPLSDELVFVCSFNEDTGTFMLKPTVDGDVSDVSFVYEKN